MRITSDEIAGATKAETAENIIKEALRVSENPIVFCSFGKDSTTVLKMAQKYKPDIEVMYLMDGKFPEKNLHAFKTAADMGIKTLHTYPATWADYIQREDYFEVIHYYYVDGTNWYVLYNGCCKHKEGDDYLCAKKDLLSQPFISGHSFPWDCIIHGQKDTEPIYIIDSYKIKTPIMPFGKGIMALPLFNWTDEEVLAYAKENNVPLQAGRYESNPYGGFSGTEADESNNDVIPTCSVCLDYRNEFEKIICPKTGLEVEFSGRNKADNEKFSEGLVKMAEYITDAERRAEV